nr:GatB/YqeY domain-containing protein [candidate division KSB1 bacterium]NIX71133.1 GatB/YqeY domain-containing protein [candidate division KSB1 bacterium]
MIGDEGAITVIKRLAKQRKDSIEQFEGAGRNELAEKEKAELAILEGYLPEMMGKDEIEKVARVKKDELGVDDKLKMGMLMGAVMKELKGKADGGDVKAV